MRCFTRRRPVEIRKRVHMRKPRLAGSGENVVRVRTATRADVPRLSEVIARSVRELQRPDYTEPQIEGALATIFGVDTTLIDDGTYLVVESESASETEIEIVACGGWSRRKTLFGGDRWTHREDDMLDPALDAAKIRAFFVDPDWARR